jgi:hypothetical protein
MHSGKKFGSNILFFVLTFCVCFLLETFGAKENGDVFMSSGEMNRVFLMEQELV